jgi:hypothetical protein
MSDYTPSTPKKDTPAPPLEINPDGTVTQGDEVYEPSGS